MQVTIDGEKKLIAFLFIYIRKTTLNDFESEYQRNRHLMILKASKIKNYYENK